MEHFSSSYHLTVLLENIFMSYQPVPRLQESARQPSAVTSQLIQGQTHHANIVAVKENLRKLDPGARVVALQSQLRISPG